MAICLLLVAHPAFAQSNTLALTKIWTNGLNGDRVTMQISGGSGVATAGTSTVGGASVDAVAVTSPGDIVTISEAYAVGNLANYNVVFSCWRTSNGTSLPLSGSGLSRTFTVPSGSGVACSITNSRKPVSLTLRKQWIDATIGNAVTVSTSGFTNMATLNSAANTANEIDTGAVVTVYAGDTGNIAENYTNGSAANYLASLSCTGNAVALSGTALTINPNDTTIVCTYANTRLVPLTMTKASAVYSDPINGTTNPKMIPGAFVDYTLTITNPASYAIDTDSILAMDQLPAPINLYLLSVSPASGPVVMTPGGSTLTYTYTSLSSSTDDVSFSNDGGASWAYTPVPNANGVDPTVTHIRINPKGAMAPGSAFAVRFRVQIG